MQTIGGKFSYGVFSLSFLVLVSTVSTQLCNSTSNIDGGIRVSPTNYGRATVAFWHCGVQVFTGDFLCPLGSPLLDGSTGPEQPDLDDLSQLRQFFAFQPNRFRRFSSMYIRQGSNVSNITAIDIYILNYPEREIGLPNFFQVYGTSVESLGLADLNGPQVVVLGFDLLHNDQLSQDDSHVRRITLRLQEGTQLPILVVLWDFMDLDQIQWFFISEVVLCTDTQPSFTPAELQVEFLSPAADVPVVIQPSATDLARRSLRLNCTVLNEGLFIWSWRKGTVELSSNTKTKILSADGTRTSILVINSLNFEDSDEYTCNVTFRNVLSYTSRQQSVLFPLTLETSISAVEDDSVAMFCEVYGYATFLNPPSWTDNVGAQVTAATTKYGLSLTNGSNTLIYMNGTIGPSLVSTLTVRSVTLDDEGIYRCSVDTVNAENVTQSVMLTIVRASTTAPISTTTSTTTDTNTTQIITIAAGHGNTTATTTIASGHGTLNIFTVAIPLAIVAVILITACTFFFIIRKCRLSKRKLRSFHSNESLSEDQTWNGFRDNKSQDKVQDKVDEDKVEDDMQDKVLGEMQDKVQDKVPEEIAIGQEESIQDRVQDKVPKELATGQGAGQESIQDRVQDKVPEELATGQGTEQSAGGESIQYKLHDKMPEEIATGQVAGQESIQDKVPEEVATGQGTGQSAGGELIQDKVQDKVPEELATGQVAGQESKQDRVQDKVPEELATGQGTEQSAGGESTQDKVQDKVPEEVDKVPEEVATEQGTEQSAGGELTQDKVQDKVPEEVATGQGMGQIDGGESMQDEVQDKVPEEVATGQGAGQEPIQDKVQDKVPEELATGQGVGQESIQDKMQDKMPEEIAAGQGAGQSAGGESMQDKVQDKVPEEVATGQGAGQESIQDKVHDKVPEELATGQGTEQSAGGESIQDKLQDKVPEEVATGQVAGQESMQDKVQDEVPEEEATGQGMGQSAGGESIQDNKVQDKVPEEPHGTGQSVGGELMQDKVQDTVPEEIATGQSTGQSAGGESMQDKVQEVQENKAVHFFIVLPSEKDEMQPGSTTQH